MKQLFSNVSRFLREENAQALVEYVLIMAVFSVVAYFGLEIFKSAWIVRFNKTVSARSGSGLMNLARRIKEII
ncbi:Flp family type IVb pilin [Elusimicrobiota bacterium]